MNPAQRKALGNTMKLLMDNESLVNYPLHDVRGPLDAATAALTGAQMRARLKQGKHLMMDCSQGIACVYKWSWLVRTQRRHRLARDDGHAASASAALHGPSDGQRRRLGHLRAIDG